MAYIRSRNEELTGYQTASPYTKTVDFANDFVMVYGIDETMPERIRQFRDAGYVVHLMTGISWGNYQNYLDGKWDGRQHWDESQRQRDGEDIIHNPTVPYMVPTASFTEYLIDGLKVAVDSGVAAIHMEEPEFWDHGGYSPAFRREYEAYYGEPWRPQHTDVDAAYKAGKLKAHLYCRTIARVSAALKAYAREKYGRELRFYVPTHSLLNYTQWKIISPEAELIGIEEVDGCIAQVWTGTSRCRNVYEGAYRERTFETAYLEYGVMQELVQGTGRRMWFLNDPIEDAAGYTWENYRYNYIKTATASLLHPHIWHYEICPWPNRVFEGKYPKVQPYLADKDETAFTVETSRSIPGSYATLLSGMFQLFGDMEQPFAFEGFQGNVGVLMSDSSMFQRTFPDGIVTGRTLDQLPEFDAEQILEDESLMLDFIQGPSFPQFFGLAMPLLKWGLPVKPVQLDNVLRFGDYLAGNDLLVLSYEYIKPKNARVNEELVKWVRDGGTLIYVGDGSDPFHASRLWWREAGYRTPAEHLFETAGIGRQVHDGSHCVGKGKIITWNMVPARVTLDKALSDEYREMVRDALVSRGIQWDYRNDLTLRRGPYILSSVMNESVDSQSKVFTGSFVDVLEEGFPVVHRKEICPDECAILVDLDTVPEGDFRVIATCARVSQPEPAGDGLRFTLRTADRIRSYTRLRLPQAPVHVEAEDTDLAWCWDAQSRTLLLTYDSNGDTVAVHVRYA